VLIRLDNLSPRPIFEQVVFQVKAAVARGDIVVGDRLPSVRELAKELAINPNTVARAYEMLESQGVIVRRQGAGCFVTGAASVLKSEQRKKRLDELAHHAVTEAFHLGFAQDELVEAIERRARDLSTRAGGKS
jgi:GntR family transcriptional regulator